MAAAKKTSSAKKTAAKKAPAKTTAAPAKRTAAKKSAAEKPAAKSAPAAKKSAAKKPPAKQAAVEKVPATKSATKETPVKKTAAASVPSTRPAPVRKKSATSMTPSLLSNATFERVEIPAPRGHTKDGIAYTKDFDVKFLKEQRDDLITRREGEVARATRLEDEATSIIEDGEMGDVQFDDEGGEGDTMVVQRDLDRVISTQARQTILEIDAALERIGEGTYGYSEISGMPIPRERLEAIPETTVLAAEKVSGIGPR